jgi:hypothetical protein
MVKGNHPAYALARWLAEHADQVWLFATVFEVDWTNNGSERAIKDPSGLRPCPGTGTPNRPSAGTAQSGPTSSRARNHGVEAIDAIHTALAGNPWLPPITIT